jgi:hypothetical protein
MKDKENAHDGATILHRTKPIKLKLRNENNGKIKKMIALILISKIYPTLLAIRVERKKQQITGITMITIANEFVLDLISIGAPL